MEGSNEQDLVSFRSLLRDLVLRSCDARMSQFQDAAGGYAESLGARSSSVSAATAPPWVYSGFGKMVALQESVAMILLALGAPKEALLTYAHTLNVLVDKASQAPDVNAADANGASVAGDPRQWVRVS